MNSSNPYESPSPFVEEDVKFALESLPFIFTVPAQWIAYWYGMLALSIAAAGLTMYSATMQISALHLILALFSVVPSCLLSLTCVRAILSRITISESGIQVSQFGHSIMWQQMESWTFGKYGNIVLLLASGKKTKIFGPSMNPNRRKITLAALKCFGVPERFAVPN